MINTGTRKNIFAILAFSLMTTSAFSLQASVNFVDELSTNDHSRMASVARDVLDNRDSRGTDLFGFFDAFSQADSAKQFRIEDLIEDKDYFNGSMPALIANGNKEDAKISFLNLIGFGNMDHKCRVDEKSALNQYMPTMHVREVNGVKNIFFENPAFTNSLFAQYINYYDSLSGLSHLVPTCVSNQKKHDQLLAYAFFGKGGDNLNVNGLSYRGEKGTRLPVVELIGKYLAKQLQDSPDFNPDEKIVFSGSGFAGAIAQEVAYQLKKQEKHKNANFKVITSQAMRYLAGDFAKDYANVLGESNVFSINTGRKRQMELSGLNYKSVYFEALGKQIRLETDTPTNGVFDGLIWKLGLDKKRYDENHKGVLFKTKDTPEQKVEKILGKGTLSGSEDISDHKFARLVPIMVDLAKGQTQASSNALATLLSDGMFLKTSKGRAEHDNLVKIRKQFGLKNSPNLMEMGDKAKMVIPASYYDPINNVTITVAHAAGDKSAHDNLKDILGQGDFKRAAAENGAKLGDILAALHKTTGSVSHGDFHLNNIRFDKEGNAYVIDVETLANNYVDGNVRDSNGFKDILDLIAKTTSHIYKSGTYGASKGFFSNFFGKKPSETEKSFAQSVLKGYVQSLDEHSLEEIKGQYKIFKDKYGSNVNKFLKGGFFSTYNNAIFAEVFKDNVFDKMLESNLTRSRLLSSSVVDLF